MLRPELADAIRALSDDIATTVEEARDTGGDTERDALLRLWHQCQLAIRTLTDLADECEQAAVPLMPWAEGPRGGRKPAPVVVDGVGAIEVRKANVRTTWDVEATTKAVVRAAMERGEIGHPLDVANLILRVAGGGLSYFKVGELAALDIDADAEELRTREGGRPGLRFVA